MRLGQRFGDRRADPRLAPVISAVGMSASLSRPDAAATPQPAALTEKFRAAGDYNSAV
ncbi:hypothetical protein I552_8285 [Mycobacterium xenopi 3993]|nr:hypothetical protein I552_8285 [Mycobacterium xenopi 3993]